MFAGFLVVQEILEKFKFRNQIDTMIDADILGAVIVWASVISLSCATVSIPPVPQAPS